MFCKKIDKILQESVIDWTRKSLDPKVFTKINNTYKLKPSIQSQIKKLINDIDKNIVEVNDYLIKGSILSYQWLETSDFDILIETNKISDENWDKANNAIDKLLLKNNNIVGTKHPIQIFIHAGEYNHDNADGIYHLKDGWVKGPYDLSIDISDYADQFKKSVESLDLKTGKLKRSLIDYSLIKTFDKNELKELHSEINKIIQSLDYNIEILIHEYEKLRDARHEAFDKDMTPEEITEYGSKNKLPDNVIYKMLERYHYIDFLKYLNKAYEDKFLSNKEIKTLKNKISNI